MSSTKCSLERHIGIVRRRRIGAVGVLTVGFILGIIGCSPTEQQQPKIIAKEQGAQSPVRTLSGLYEYINPATNWSQYNAVMVDPVSFWDSEDSSVSWRDQQLLCDYFFIQFRRDLAKYSSVLDEPGPRVMRMQAAITNAHAATPVLRTASIVTPEGPLLGRAAQMETGRFAFVGSARAEAKLTDAQTD
jgi:hypothetical protein